MWGVGGDLVVDAIIVWRGSFPLNNSDLYAIADTLRKGIDRDVRASYCMHIIRS